MKVQVTERDIRMGFPCLTDLNNCIIARALKRAGMKPISHSVWDHLPAKVETFIEKACAIEDKNTKSLKPFTFVLTDRVLRQIASEEM